MLRTERLAGALLVLAAAFLVFCNLDINPRPWHDEGSALSVPKTLVEDGVYATRNVDEYQTFGAVQSVGPTVLLPIALVFKLDGVGLTQGRFVLGLYTLMTLWLFYLTGVSLFNRRAALFGVTFLLASPAAGFLLYGRQVLGEVPALGFLLGSWLVWFRGVQSTQRWHPLIGGILLGAAMVTKSQYVVLAGGTVLLAVVLDRLYFRQRQVLPLLIMGAVSAVCVAVWTGWQMAYFGKTTFLENLAKLHLLGQSTTGFHPKMAFEAIRFLAGSGTGHLYYFWGPTALLYVAFLAIRRNKRGLTLTFLLLFTFLWLTYFTFWNLPWPRYVFPAAAIMALFVGKLYDDLLRAFFVTRHAQACQPASSPPDSVQHPPPAALTSLGSLVALVTMGLLTLYQLQQTVRDYVLDRVGQPAVSVLAPQQLQAPGQIARFLNANVDRSAIVETWERELTVLTSHRYHAPDQALLAEADKTIYFGVPNRYALGPEYFGRVRPAYVVVGWYSRYTGIYDEEYLKQHGEVVATSGTADWRYDVYKLRVPAQ